MGKNVAKLQLQIQYRTVSQVAQGAQVDSWVATEATAFCASELMFVSFGEKANLGD